MLLKSKIKKIKLVGLGLMLTVKETFHKLVKRKKSHIHSGKHAIKVSKSSLRMLEKELKRLELKNKEAMRRKKR
jgi:hypothetical protein